MASELKLTVAVSCYKQEEYIATCLQSILDQQVCFDFEIVVGDDLSPDRTRAVILQFVDRYPGRITTIFNEKNLGAARNYFSVHSKARGKYVAHIDGDDVMLPGKLQAQVDVMEANPECNVVFHRSHYFSDDGSYQSDTGPLFENGRTVFLTASQLARWGPIAAHGSYMYRRSTRLTLEYEFDFMEWYLAFEAVAQNGFAAYINEIFLNYRCNPTGNAYLATQAGREKSYSILIQNVIHCFSRYPRFRTDLYTQLLINAAMYFKNSHRIPMNWCRFMLRHAGLFRPARFIESVRVRKMVAPNKKIR